MASPTPRQSISPDIVQQNLKTFYVFHINRSLPEEMNIDAVQAPDAEEARRVAERLFPVNAILQVRMDGKNDVAPEVGGYPSARFIKGKFHGAVFEEDELEFDY